MQSNRVVDSSKQPQNKPNRFRDLFDRFRFFLNKRKPTRVYAVDTSSPKIQKRNNHPQDLIESPTANKDETIFLHMGDLLKTSSKTQGDVHSHRLSIHPNPTMARRSPTSHRSPTLTPNILISANTIVLINCKLEVIIKTLKDIALSDLSNIKVLILRCVKIEKEDEYYDSEILQYHSAFFELMELIKGMHSLTHLELTNFIIDIGFFLRYSGVNFVNYLFTNILILNKETHFNFNDNTFIDDVKEREYSFFINRYWDTERIYKYELLPPLIVMRLKTLFLLEWVCNNNEITRNPDSYIYKKWLEWLVYTENAGTVSNKKIGLTEPVRDFKKINADFLKIYIDDIYVKGLNVDKTTEYYKEFINVWNTPNKEFYLQTEGFYRAFYEGMKPEEMGFYKSFRNDKYYMDLAERTKDFYKRFNEGKNKRDDEYEGFLLKKPKEIWYKRQISSGNKSPDNYKGFLLKSDKQDTEEEKKKKDWFKWLLSNNTVAGRKLDTKYDDIIERLFIVIEGFKNAFDEKIKGFKNIDDYDSFLICLIYSIVISFDEEVMTNIIKEFDGISNKYNPTEIHLTRKYNDIIEDRLNRLMRPNGKITTFATSQITKELRGVSGVSGVSGGRKTKSKSRKPPKKAREEPNKPSKKTLNKPSKKPTKKVALKEPNVYGVIKHKIKI
jgi:hypothetical protein